MTLASTKYIREEAESILDTSNLLTGCRSYSARRGMLTKYIETQAEGRLDGKLNAGHPISSKISKHIFNQQNSHNIFLLNVTSFEYFLRIDLEATRLDSKSEQINEFTAL